MGWWVEGLVVWGVRGLGGWGVGVLVNPNHQSKPPIEGYMISVFAMALVHFQIDKGYVFVPALGVLGGLSLLDVVCCSFQATSAKASGG